MAPGESMPTNETTASANQPEPTWQEKANCRGVDPNIFFPVTEEPRDIRAAKKICDQCIVAAECLDYAFENREHDGIWGGATERERRRIIRRRQKADRKLSQLTVEDTPS